VLIQRTVVALVALANAMILMAIVYPLMGTFPALQSAKKKDHVGFYWSGGKLDLPRAAAGGCLRLLAESGRDAGAAFGN
jgi:hypothetical protein